MRELNVEEIQVVDGGVLGFGESSGYAETAMSYGRGVAMVAGLSFGITGALAAGAAFTVGWAIGLGINYLSSGGSTGVGPNKIVYMR